MSEEQGPREGSTELGTPGKRRPRWTRPVDAALRVLAVMGAPVLAFSEAFHSFRVRTVDPTAPRASGHDVVDPWPKVIVLGLICAVTLMLLPRRAATRRRDWSCVAGCLLVLVLWFLLGVWLPKPEDGPSAFRCAYAACWPYPYPELLTVAPMLLALGLLLWYSLVRPSQSLARRTVPAVVCFLLGHVVLWLVWAPVLEPCFRAPRPW